MNETSSTSLKNLTSGKSIFLSILIASLLLRPAIALFIGLASALNNWRKLDMRNRVIPYFVIGLVIGLLTYWITDGHIDYDEKYIFLITFFVGILIVNGFAFHLWKQMDRDIISLQTNQITLEKPVQGKWGTYFLTMLIALFFITTGSDLAIRLFGYCWIPTLPDITNRIFDQNREGIEKLVMRADDFACGVTFLEQRTAVPDVFMTSPTASDSYSRVIYFVYFNRNDLTFQRSDLHHYIWVETNQSEIEKFRQIPDRYDPDAEKYLEVPIAQLTAKPDIMRVRCPGYEGDEDIYCRVTIVRGNIISEFSFDAANLPPEEFWRILNSVIVNTDKQIQEYQSQ